MDDHWLTRASTIKRLWLVFGVVLAATVMAQVWIPNEPHFEVERVFAFNALYGFLACAVMILAAKGLGLLLKRPDTYYDDRSDD